MNCDIGISVFFTIFASSFNTQMVTLYGRLYSDDIKWNNKTICAVS